MINWTYKSEDFKINENTLIPEGDHRVVIAGVKVKTYSSGNEGLEVYSKGELRYYYASGDLIRISWVQDQIEYCVMGGFEADLSAYPQNATDTVLCGLLSYQTAENTYSTLFSEK